MSPLPWLAIKYIQYQKEDIFFFLSKRSLIQFGSEFDMKDLGPLSYLLGIVVTR
jgi:hypothetical protein